MKKGILIALGLLVLILIGIGVYRNMNQQNDKEVIKIGAILPLTGHGAIAGEYSRMGLELAIEKYNLNNDRKAKLIIQDSKSNAKDGVTALRQILNNNMVNLIYSQLSNVCLAVKPITEKMKIINLGVSGSTELLYDSKYMYRNYSDPSDVAITAIQFALDSLSSKKITILYSNNDFGKSINIKINNYLLNRKIVTVKSIPYEDGILDYNNYVLKALTLQESDVIYIVGLGKSVGLLIKKLRTLKYNGAILGGLETPFPDVIEAAGESINGVYYVSFNYNQNTDPTDFTKAFSQKYNVLPQAPSIVAYTAILTILENGLSIDSLKGKNIESPLGPFILHENNFKYPLVIKQIIR